MKQFPQLRKMKYAKIVTKTESYIGDFSKFYNICLTDIWTSLLPNKEVKIRLNYNF
jgi:hypothetical protein